MNEAELSARFEEAIKKLGPYIKAADDGGLKLVIKDGKELGIDPVTFADLKQSLERTNIMIKNREIDREEILSDLREN